MITSKKNTTPAITYTYTTYVKTKVVKPQKHKQQMILVHRSRTNIVPLVELQINILALLTVNNLGSYLARSQILNTLCGCHN